MKKLIETILILAVCLGGMYVFTLQRAEITALHIKIDSLKSIVIYDTIPTYIIKGIVKKNEVGK